MGSTIIVPDLTITEQGVGPAQDVWPDTAAGSGNVGVGAEFGQVLTTQGPSATPTSLPLTAEWISPTNNPTWTQATWFIDPANSTGLASDLNSGIDATHPVLTYNGGVVAKWGTTRPTLVQNTSITWMSDAPADASDPVVCLPVISGIGSGNGVVVTLQGVLGAAQTLHTGALAGVVAKNRPAKQLLEADLGFAAPIGSLVQNTMAGKSSYAWVYQNVAGTVFSLTEPMAPTVLPFNDSVFTPVDTWANGDTFTVFSPVKVNLVETQPSEIVSYNLGLGFPVPLQVVHIAQVGADGPTEDGYEIGGNTIFIESSSNSQLEIQPSASATVMGCVNVFLTSGVFGVPNATISMIVAGAIISPFGSIASISTLDYDIIVDGQFCVVPAGSAQFLTVFGQVFLQAGTFLVVDRSTASFPNAAFATPSGMSVLWGSGNLDVAGSARLIYNSGAGQATAIFINGPTGIFINGQTSASSYDAATHAWAGPIALTAANLDAAFPAGFGGLAINVGGGSITNQFAP